jgi:hypothetical protein
LSKNTKEPTTNMKKVDISPEVSMYNLLKSYAYNLGGALSEYIDNSLQSFLENKENLTNKKLRITIYNGLKI